VLSKNVRKSPPRAQFLATIDHMDVLLTVHPPSISMASTPIPPPPLPVLSFVSPFPPPLVDDSKAKLTLNLERSRVGV